MRKCSVIGPVFNKNEWGHSTVFIKPRIKERGYSYSPGNWWNADCECYRRGSVGVQKRADSHTVQASGRKDYPGSISDEVWLIFDRTGKISQ